LEEQVKVVLRALEGAKYQKGSPTYVKALEWLKRWPRDVDLGLQKRLEQAICESFGVSEAEVWAAVEGRALPALKRSSEDELREILPKEGWLANYIKMTEQVESPLSYHVTSAFTLLGAALGRRCWFSMGFFNVYPNWSSIIVGPTGKVRKTSAVDIALSIVHELALCPVMADKVTPESFASALKESSQQFIYAPEFSVMFGKQQYNEGLVTLIIRLLDCPEVFSVRTQKRGTEEIHQPTLHVLGASTMSLLSTATPGEVLNSGFLNRFVVVVEEGTDRCFPIPVVGMDARRTVLDRVGALKVASGEIRLDPATNDAHTEWYRELKGELQRADEVVASMIERSQVHVLRAATLLHLAECGTENICCRCFQTAANLIRYFNLKAPSTARAVERSAQAQDSDYVLGAIVKMGGSCTHTDLVRRVSNRMNSRQLKGVITTLEERGDLHVGKRGMGRIYVLRETNDGTD